jgi:hypothetical protein
LEKDILRDISVLSGLLPIILFLVFLRRNKEKNLWVIFLYTIVSLITDIAFRNLPAGDENAEFYLFSFFTIIEYSIFTTFIFLQISSKAVKWFIGIISIGFYGFAIYNIARGQSSNFDSLSASVECVLVILFCIFFFAEEIRNPEVSFIYSSKVFWVTTAVLIYLAATLFLFISAPYFTEEQMDSYWSINFISNILKNILLSIAFILPKHKSPPPSDRDLYNKAFAPPFN